MFIVLILTNVNKCYSVRQYTTVQFISSTALHEGCLLGRFFMQLNVLTAWIFSNDPCDGLGIQVMLPVIGRRWRDRY